MPLRERAKLLGVGYGLPGYGFGRVFGSLYPRLQARWEIEHLEFSRCCADTEAPWWPLHFTQRPAVLFGHLEFAALVQQRRPDIVFFSLDVWQLPRYLQALAEAHPVPRAVAYCPVDSPLPVGLDLGGLERLDALVVPTSFGRTQANVALASQGVRLRRSVCVVPHGVDASQFHRLAGAGGRSGAQRAREELFPGEPELDDAFIVLNANRNQPRKRLDLTLQGFAMFAADKPRTVKLLLHSGTTDLGSSTVALAHDLGVLDRVLWTRHQGSHPVVNDERLNLVYNACQVGINTCTSEGWGLPAFEHASTRAAQIVPSHSACGELWRGFATVLQATSYEQSRGMVHGGEVSPDDVARALERLYRDPVYLDEQSRAALENARRPDLEWNAVSRTFEDLFFEILG